ncbi:hypothetical protein H9P43_006704 [Blastocladiella emersonii ATCC 22665]|nr:hypothetical protein H9P43_006704 [Blastocladiella emersonii ATCC 22665]
MHLKTARDQFPQRAAQIAALEAYLASPSLPVPFPIFVSGSETTGKSAVLRAAARDINAARPLSAAYVSCKTAYSAKLALSKTVRQWSSGNDVKVDSLCSFVHAVQAAVPASDALQRWMILDDAHYMLDWGAQFVMALVRAIELTERNLVLVLVSTRDWRSFSSTSPILPLTFPPYTKPELASILRAMNAAAIGPDPDPLFDVLAEALIDSVRQCCTNLLEFNAGLARLYPRARQLVADDEVRPNQIAKLFAILKEDIWSIAAGLFSGHSTAVDTYDRPGVTPAAAAAARRAAGTTGKEQDLPTVTKYLLVASYLASYNPASVDRQFFARGRDPTAVKKRRTEATKGKKTTIAPVRQQLLGPKAFPLERMLAIFYAIADGNVDHAEDVLSQVATLVALCYLTRVSASDALDNYRLKCNLAYDAVFRIAQSIRFNIQECLADVHN